ncbi:hypothetical protein JCM11251_006931 [Rhodosporidiobolus azoricus]
MDGPAIYHALVSFAATASSDAAVFPTPTLLALANLAVSPAVTAPPALQVEEGGEDLANRILSALAANAALPSSLVPTLVSSTHLSALASYSSLDAISPGTPETGFLTSRLSLLPTSVKILLGVFLLLLGLFFLICGTRAVYWGRDWGRKRGDDGKGWIGGGVGGILAGAVVLGTFSAFLILSITASQSPPTLGGWPTLAIIFVPSLLGAVLGGRWDWAAKIAYAVLASLSFSLLLTLSLRLSAPLPRILLLLFPLLLSLLCLFLPALASRTQRFLLPALCALSGSMLFVLSIDAFPKVRLGVVDALGLLVTRNGVGVESGKGVAAVVVLWNEGGVKGLLAAWWILTVLSGAGMGIWGLGIEGDESWNTYLSRFAASHPSTPAGTHLSSPSLSERLRALFPFFRPRSSPSPLTELPSRQVSPWDDEEDDFDEDDLEKGSLRFHCHQKYHRGRNSRSRAGGHEISDAWDSDVETLFSPSFPPPTRAKSPTSVRSKASSASKPARYGAVSSSYSDGEEDAADEQVKPKLGGKSGLWESARGRGSMDSPCRAVFPPHMGRSETGYSSVRSGGSGLSGSTAVSSGVGAGGAREVAKRIEEDEAERYDEVAALPTLPKHQHQHKHPESSTKSSVKARLARLLPSSSSSRSTPALYSSSPSSAKPANGPLPASRPANAVPGTPSLLLALDRLRQAQQQAREPAPPAASSSSSKDTEKREAEAREGDTKGGGLERRKSMDDWWGEVVRKSEGR